MLSWAARVLAAGGLVVASVAAVPVTPAGAAPAETPLSGPRVFGGGFTGPDAVSSDGTHVWVANQYGNSVTELDAATGKFVRVITGPAFGFNQPDAISSDGTHVWVANQHGNSVTELDAATGALVQVLSEVRAIGFNEPHGDLLGRHPRVGHQRLNNSVTELDAATGALVQVLSGSSYGFNCPEAVSSDGTHVWVANQHGNSVTELDAATGALVQVLSGSSYGFTRSGCDLLRRHPRVGRQLRRQLGDRAGRRHRRAGPGHLRLQLRVHRPGCDLLGRHPRVGRQRCAATR